MHTTKKDHDAREGTQPIVVGYDGSAAAGVALDTAIRIADLLRAPVRLISTWQVPIAFQGYPAGGWLVQEDQQTRIDEAVRCRFGEHMPAWFSTVSVEGGAARVLIAASQQAQMLVVGSRGHGGFVGLLLGSVSTACAGLANCPVLVVHAPAGAQADATDLHQGAATSDDAEQSEREGAAVC